MAFPLIRDAFAILGSSKCEYISILDLKDAYHTIKLLDSSKPYFNILSYFVSAKCVYERMAMGLSTSPAMWKSYTNAIPSCIPDRSKYLSL